MNVLLPTVHPRMGKTWTDAGIVAVRGAARASWMRNYGAGTPVVSVVATSYG